MCAVLTGFHDNNKHDIALNLYYSIANKQNVPYGNRLRRREMRGYSWPSDSMSYFHATLVKKIALYVLDWNLSVPSEETPKTYTTNYQVAPGALLVLILMPVVLIWLGFSPDYIDRSQSAKYRVRKIKMWWSPITLLVWLMVVWV